MQEKLESKADMMFEELGYEKMENDYCIVYMKEWNYCEIDSVFEEWASFRFGLSDKTVYADESFDPKSITMEELKAVNAKVKELGWLDE